MRSSWKGLLVSAAMLLSLSSVGWAQNDDYLMYAVKADDTLDRLAARQRVTPEAITRLNPQLKSGILPVPGTVIFLPVFQAPKVTPRPVTRSRSGDKGGSAETSSSRGADHDVKLTRGGASELSEDEVEAVYESTVKPLGGRAAEVASLPPAALPDHQNVIVTSDGSTIAVPQARSRVKATPKKEEAAGEKPARRQLTSRRSQQCATLLRNALKYMGVPYVWGGESPSGFDCSGFVQHVYGRCGIPLPRTADLQFNVGQVVARGKEQPGDLVFFETYCPGPSHIGIFLGRHQFVHASSGQGQITISDLREEFFQARYLGAKRVW